VVLGHNYNIFLGLKGGKGLGSLTGSMLVLSPITFLYILALVILIALLIRDTNTASGLGILTLPVILGLQKGELAFYLVGAAISLLVAVKHIRDFKAYLQGRRRLI
jgi:acyl phosphate:glycerol-3-phosphate acyltransferase